MKNHRKNIEEILIKLLIKNINQKIKISEIKKNKRLYSDGFLDSYSLICLIIDLEKAFSIHFQKIKFLKSDFDSLLNLSNLIIKNAKNKN